MLLTCVSWSCSSISYFFICHSPSHTSDMPCSVPPAHSQRYPCATSAMLQQQQLTSSCTQRSLSQNQTLHFKGHFSCGGHNASLGGFHSKWVSFPLSWKRNNLRLWSLIIFGQYHLYRSDMHLPCKHASYILARLFFTLIFFHIIYEELCHSQKKKRTKSKLIKKKKEKEYQIEIIA